MELPKDLFHLLFEFSHGPINKKILHTIIAAGRNTYGWNNISVTRSLHTMMIINGLCDRGYFPFHLSIRALAAHNLCVMQIPFYANAFTTVLKNKDRKSELYRYLQHIYNERYDN